MSESLKATLRRVVGLALLAASLTALWLGQAAFPKNEVEKGIRLFFVGLSLAALLALVLPKETDAPALRPPPPLEPWEKLFLLVAFAAAALLRFPNLESWPPGGFYDEAQNVIVASQILKGSFPVFVADASQMPALYFYPVAVAIALLGKSIAAVRAVSALCGALCVPVLYLLARRFYTKGTAAAAAILLIGLRWHLNFSRIGFNGIVSPLLETLAILLLVRALESRRTRDWLLFGLVVGVGLQTYYAFNLFPAVLVVVVVGFCLRGGLATFRTDARPALVGLGWSLAAAFLILLPLIVFAIRHPEQFFQRAGTVAIWNPQHKLPMPETLFLNIRTHLLMFSFHGDGNPRHNIPDQPLFTPLASILLTFGTGAALGRGLRWPRPAILAWAIVMLLPGILTIEAPQAYRTIGAVPAIVLLMAEGLETLTRLSSSSSTTGRKPVLIGLSGVAFAVLLTAFDASIYFGHQVRDPRVWQAFDADQKEIARFLKTAAPGKAVYVDPFFYDVPLNHIYLGDGFKSMRFRLSEHLPKPDPRPTDEPLPALFVLDAFQKDLVPIFKQVFPHATALVHADPTGRPMFVSIEVPRDERTPPLSIQDKGYLASFYQNESWSGEPALTRQEAAILFHYHWDADALPDPFTADWAAHLAVAKPGTYRFEMLAGSPAAVIVDGRKVVIQSRFESTDLVSGSVELTEGPHVIVVRYLEKSYVSSIRLWWSPPGEARSVIPLPQLTAFTPAEYAALRPELPPLDKTP